MRDYQKFDAYYRELIGDIYPQPPDAWHYEQTVDIIRNWISVLTLSSVLDVGCGEGHAQDMFGCPYTGVAMGDDVARGLLLGRTVFGYDYNFLPYGDESFDLVFSRHSLEHSPFPIVSLMEWHRVSKKWLCVVVPNPSYSTWSGQNHYSLATPKQMAFWLRRAGWKIQRFKLTDKEFQFLCVKRPRVSSEGWADAPLIHNIFRFERDELLVDGRDRDATPYIWKENELI